MEATYLGNLMGQKAPGDANLARAKGRLALPGVGGGPAIGGLRQGDHAQIESCICACVARRSGGLVTRAGFGCTWGASR